jgi:hypothetical protein
MPSEATRVIILLQPPSTPLSCTDGILGRRNPPEEIQVVLTAWAIAGT